MLTQKRLRELYKYCPLTGNFYSRKFPDKIVGHNKDGYICIRIDNKDYQAHRLVYLYVEGTLPELDVDHINMVRSDNSWGNLRKCNRSDNMKNTKAHKDSRSGIKNVFFRRDTGKYSVRITTKGGYKNYGCFDDIELAELVAIEARHKFHGEFSRND